MSLQDLLTGQQITKALIIDDGYDSVPKAEDLRADLEAWSIFIDDAKTDPAVLEVFPQIASTAATELRESDEFVAAVWEGRDKISGQYFEEFFRLYNQSRSVDRDFLNRLEAGLQEFGVEPIRVGRDMPTEIEATNIIFADLFLGNAQQDADIERSLERLMPLISGRRASPPLVVLMSRSDLLETRKADFRDKAKLVGAMFRVYRKADLIEGNNLERALHRLASNRPDGIKVANFLHCWEQGLEKASERFLDGIRRLDLSDYAQISEILLSYEGQPLGSYLLDVFDRVLAHEIEGDVDTINAAGELNKISTDTYPAPHIAGSPDLQHLTYRTIWQNPRRLVVKSTVADIPIGFGDVLIKRSILENLEDTVKSEPDALVALTPACDCVRADGAKRILLLAGKLSEVTAGTWSYKGKVLRTPVLVLPGSEKRMMIRWDVKDIRTFTLADIDKLISSEGLYKTALRLREAHALELQQKLLADMGRVGVLAPIPATFSVNVAARYMRPDKTLADVSNTVGVCYVGRDEDGEENTKLVLMEPTIDELLLAIESIAEGDVHPSARDTLRRLKAAKGFAIDLQKGLAVPASGKSGFSPITSDVPVAGGATSKGAIGLIARNPQADVPGEVKNAALILTLSDQD